MYKKGSSWNILLIPLNLLIIGIVAVRYLVLSYPDVGHDYSLAIPHIIDLFLFQRLNGVGIQWYTPTFGGGLPVFPDPNSIQYSLPVFLTFFFQPWNSIIISSVLIISAGFLASYYLFIRVLKLHWTSSLLGAIFFSANGFILQRIAVGHLGYQVFPLLAVAIVLLLDPALPRWIGGLIFSLTAASLIYQAGYFLIFIFAMAILISLPIIYIYRPEILSWKRLLTVCALGGGVGLLLTGSKIAAVYAFMRFFPRYLADNYPVGVGQGLVGIVFQLLGTMTLAPLLKLVGLHPSQLTEYMNTITGAHYGYWEFDMSLSPVVFGIILIGIYSFIRKPTRHLDLFRPRKKWVAWIFLFLVAWIVIEFILAKGFVYPRLRAFPILSSLHVNPRFTAAFIFPLAMLAALIYNAWAIRLSARKSISLFIVINIITLLPLATFFMIDQDLQGREYDISESFRIYEAIRSGDSLEITGINEDLSNTQALASHESNLYPYAPVFGYRLESFHPEVQDGAVWTVTDGYYNMTNPTGYVFPEINGTRPFERIRVGDEENLALFLSHQKTNWEIPVYQQILNWVSGVTFWIVLAVLGTYGALSWHRHRRELLRKV